MRRGPKKLRSPTAITASTSASPKAWGKSPCRYRRARTGSQPSWSAQTQKADSLRTAPSATNRPTEARASRLSGLPDGLKENIELADASQPSTFGYDLAASTGLTAQLTEDGSIEFPDSEGEVVFLLPAPTMYDRSGMAPASAIHYDSKPKKKATGA